MGVFAGWREHAVPQRHPETGCIPTAYELLLRAAGLPGIDFAAFQETFDLERSGAGRNDFSSVAGAVKEQYPHVSIETKSFPTGADKLAFILSQLAGHRPVIISIALAAKGPWHIVPVVDADERSLTVLWQMRTDGDPEIRTFSYEELVQRHDEWQGGNDVAFLNSSV